MRIRTIISPQKEQANLLEHSYISPVFRPSLSIIDSSNDYVFDHTGKKYIDFTSGIAVNAFGHKKFSTIHASIQQMFKVIHVSNLFTAPPQLSLCKYLVQLANKSIKNVTYKSVFLSNSGTEANEAALKFAKLVAKRHHPSLSNKVEIISFENSFHGRTLGALSVTGQDKYKIDFAPLLPNITVLPYNDIDALKNAVTNNTAAIIVELIQGEGGLSKMSTEFAHAINTVATAHNVTVIADEVQTGLYRAGALFASKKVGLMPHIITLSKSLGGGFPLGATITSDTIHDILKPGDHGTTIGGNPVICNVALTNLKKLTNQITHSKITMSTFWLNYELNAVVRKYKNIAIRKLGDGAMRGIQFSTMVDVHQIVEYARKHGLLLLTTGTHSIRIMPSLVCKKHVIKKGMRILHKVINKIKKSEK